MITDLYSREYYRQPCPCPAAKCQALAPGREAWPAEDPLPTVLSTGPQPEGVPEVPRAVLGLQRAAEAAGWAIRVGYSEGQRRGVSVGTYKPVRAYGIHSDAAHGWRFNAVYDLEAKGWYTIAIWPVPFRPVAPGLGSRFTHASVTDLKEWITVRGSVLPAWFKGIHARVEEQRERQKAAARNRKPKAKEGQA
jgi:hypothetical protein